jgi:hypothetical protein
LRCNLRFKPGLKPNSWGVLDAALKRRSSTIAAEHRTPEAALILALFRRKLLESASAVAKM